MTRKKKPAGKKQKPKRPDLSQLRPGMPALDSVVEVAEFLSPQNVKYKILKTNERDEYDPVLGPRKAVSRKSQRS
jgi:hypothetical protein